MWSFYLLVIAFFMLNLSYQAVMSFKSSNLCTLKSGRSGVCKKLTECPSAIYDIDFYGKWPSYCSFTGYELIVCCDENIRETTTTSIPSNTPHKMVLSKEETIKIAKKKCSQYSEIREQELEAAVYGGEPAEQSESPHMAHLGYGTEEIEYKCGASLISEEFLLTAAHCLQSEGSPVTLAKLGTDDEECEIIATISERIPHPDWNPVNHYHDIALLRLEEPIQFDSYARPACIQTEKQIDDIEGEATGWGLTGPHEEQSDMILKVKLPFMNHSECSKTYRKNRFLKNGIDDDSMLCAGGVDIGRDTCPGDSGGPLQVHTWEKSGYRFEKVYNIVGITSFGPSYCGKAPGVYTRVSHYVPWIVSNVWPEEVEYSITEIEKNWENIDIRYGVLKKRNP